MDLGDQKALDARVEKLWQTLDTQKKGHLDVRGLKKGLKTIDHRSSTKSRADLTALIFSASSQECRRYAPGCLSCGRY